MKLLALIAGLTLIACTPVMAAPCMDRPDALDLLARQHGEKPVSRALFPVAVGQNPETGLMIIEMRVAELLMSENGETWTMILTDSEGKSCQFGHGTDWQHVTPEYGVAG